MIKIEYIEFWAVRHCNLNCKGCSACAPIEEPWFLDKAILFRDLTRLKELGLDIDIITVLGGEPLLHPDLIGIFDTIKQIYPKAKKYIITNGILLTEMSNAFWQYCKDNDIFFRVTFFPVLTTVNREKILAKLNDNNLNYKITDKKMFNKILVLDNDTSISEIFEHCGCNNAYNLYNGFIARCPVPFVVPSLNTYFQTKFVEGGALDIHKVPDAKTIIDFLNNPTPACHNCSIKREKVQWSLSSKRPQLNDWLID